MTRADLIEAMARAIHAAFQEGRGSPHPFPPEGFRGPWIKEAAAALSAIEASGCVVVQKITAKNAADCLRKNGHEAAARNDSVSAHWMNANADELDAMLAASPFRREG